MSLFQFFVNGEWIEFDDFEDDWSLSHALRDRLGLTGTKIGCGSGGCGSCTVLISKFDGLQFRHFTVNACITPIYSVYGCHILTVEGLGDKDGIDPVQDAIARENGTQCGFCTPGFVMSMTGLQKQKSGSEINVNDIKLGLQGNLCRCTGYRPIIEGFKQCSKKCSDCKEPCATSGDIEDQKSKAKCNSVLQFPYFENLRNTKNPDEKFEKIETLLKDYQRESENVRSRKFISASKVWLVPKNQDRLLKNLREFPEAKIVAGGTSNTLQNITAIADPQAVIDISLIQELKTVHLGESCLTVGSMLTIQEVDEAIMNSMKQLSDEQTGILKAFRKLVRSFASPQIRNVATIGGSLSEYSDISDLQTFVQGFGVSINHLKLSEEEDESNFNSLVISSIDIPLTQKGEIAWFKKISRRNNFDMAVLNSTFKYNESLSQLQVTFGGLAVKRFKLDFDSVSTIDSLLENEEVIKKIEDALTESKKHDDFKHTLEYIQTLAKGLLRKFSIWIKENSSQNPIIPEENTFKATRIFETPEEGLPSDSDLVYKAIPHASAYKHATGEAKFCDDTPKFHNELEMVFVLSTRAHAKIVNINYESALAVDGVVGYISAEDLSPENNKFGLIVRDEEVFASEKVTAVGQIIAGILATDRLAAKKASKLVEIEYEDLQPMILTNEDAIANKSYYEGYGMTLQHGECKNVCGTSPYIISGEVKVGSQEHFYMEPNGCIAIPNGEDHEMEIISSTQNPNGTQLQIATMLNVPANRILVKVKRVGGGFGGKEVRCLMVSLPTAAAAHKFKKPVRTILDRETDMRITGHRHFYLSRHKIAFDDNGKLQALRMEVYANAGNTLDVSMAPIERILLNMDNAYNIPNMNLEGFVCKTNIPSNTVCRGTGGPQAVFLIENIMDVIAATLDKDSVKVRQIQLYKEGDLTPYGQPLINCTVQQCWDECVKISDYHAQRVAIEEFNSKNQFVKRGISLNPCNFGIGYTALHLNQGAALVNIYTDGSVLISHAGVEIGNGVHSKMIQVATRELGIPASKIRIVETATDKVPNGTPSSASVTSDLNGGAVMDACRQLHERLQPYWIENSDATWEELVNKAYLDRVSLSAVGFYKAPEMGWNGKKGTPWNYFSTGAACTVVEVDCLTGTFKILKTDIVMDAGKSLNPALDIGQIEGAFMMGVGLFLLEEVIIDSKGALVSADPSTYKIPTAFDTPLEFNVSLLKGASNPKAIYSSKTVGEPPLVLATSVFFAVKDAIRQHRKSIGASAVFDMDSPATIQNILMACQK